MTPEESLALKLDRDGAWLRRLARSLVRDEELAEDAVQSTLLTALERGGGPRRWLATVLRNVVRQDHRARVRRSDREALRARPDEAPATADVAGRLELQERVLRAVGELEEPYRAALVARYFDERPPREIARDEQLPVRTVHARLHRALGMLRGRLDREFGGREDWLRAMVPFAPAPWIGAGGLGAKLGLALVAAVVLVGPALWVAGELASPPQRPVAPVDGTPTLVSAPPLDEVSVSASDSGSEERRRVGEAPVVAEEDSIGDTLLSLRVLEHGSGTPLPRVYLRVEATRASDPESGGFRLIGHRTTDAEGRAHIALEPGQGLRITAVPPSGDRDPLDPIDRGELWVPPLAAGETRDAVLHLHHGPDRVFFGRVIEADGDAPVPVPVKGARIVASWAPDQTCTVSDAEGRFEVPYPSWLPCQLAVHADGYSLAIWNIAGPDPFPDDPALVRLVPGANVRVELATGDGMPEGLSVQLEMSGRGLVQPRPARLEFSPPGFAKSVVDGAVEFWGLPANVELVGSVWRDRAMVWRAPDPIVLGPRANPDLIWSIGLGADVIGRLVDGDGAPIPDHPLWLIPSRPGDVHADEDDDPPGMRLFDPDEATLVHLEGRTDAEGRFLFEGVMPGSWWLGPTPFDAAAARDAPSDVAAQAWRFELTEEDTVRELVLEATRGRTISGRLVSRRGRQLYPAVVYASERHGLGRVRAEARQDGSFVVGPLAPGSYRLSAHLSGSMSQSGRTTASAGERDVVIPFDVGGSITGRTVDPARGEGVEASVSLIMVDSGSMSTSTVGRGTFEFSGLRPGTYNLSASTRDGRVAVLGGLEIDGDTVIDDALLFVERAGRIEVFFEAEGNTRCAVRTRSMVVGDVTVRPGGRSLFHVPPGTVELEFYRHVDGQVRTLAREVCLVASDELVQLDVTLDL